MGGAESEREDEVVGWVVDEEVCGGEEVRKETRERICAVGSVGYHHSGVCGMMVPADITIIYYFITNPHSKLHEVCNETHPLVTHLGQTPNEILYLYLFGAK